MLFLFAVMACYIVMRFLAFEFVYQINDRAIVIKQKSGKNEKTMSFCSEFGLAKNMRENWEFAVVLWWF